MISVSWVGLLFVKSRSSSTTTSYSLSSSYSDNDKIIKLFYGIDSKKN